MQDIENPWYREPWPWLLIGLPAIAVLASLTSAVLAFDGADPIIADNYYQRGLDINQTLGRVQQAAALGVHASLAYDGLQPGAAIWVKVHATGAVQDTALQLHLIHPSRSGIDREVMLGRVPGTPDSAAEFTGRWPDAAAGARPAGDPAATQWWVQLQGRTWQVEGALSGRADLAAH